MFNKHSITLVETLCMWMFSTTTLLDDLAIITNNIKLMQPQSTKIEYIASTKHTQTYE